MKLKTKIMLPWPNAALEKIVYVVSDMHMGDASLKDDFCPNAELFIDFLNHVGSENVITAGDVEEHWQCKPTDIKLVYDDILSQLSRGVAGNHDSHRLVSNIELPDTIVIGNALIFHGHQMDPWNARYKWFGRLITRLVGWLELIGLKHIDNFFLANTPACLTDEEFVRVFPKLLVELKRYAYNFQVNTIVYGHTHRADLRYLTNNIVIGNCGTWAIPQFPCYTIEITPETLALYEVCE